MTKFLNISTDNTLGGSSPSDVTVSSQKAVKEYVDSHSGSGAVNSVNGQTGTVVLTASDVGAQPAGNYMTTDTIQTVSRSATKTFNGRVNFLGTGDANAIYLSTDTRIDVNGTTRTVLGFANGTFLINNSAYALNLRGSGARPAWNGTSYLALTSDIGNATLTIQKNGTAVDTFTANATSDKTINITVPTKTSDLTNDDGFITGINSSDVTTALGFTPYDASNPNGYTSNTGTVTSVNNVSPVNGNVSLSIPTVNNPTITITQGGVTKGSITLNQSTDETIELDAGAGGGANTDLSNLTSTGQNIGNWSSNVTNCLTYIPQDIKLELNNGTLTLKAGSKVYMPNGFEQDGTTTKFETVQSTTDLSYSTTWGAGYQCFVVAYVDDSNNISAITMCRSDLAFSGTTAPSTTTGGSTWYDTSANKIKVYRGGAWVVDSTSEPRTLFLGVVTVGTGNVITSIDQVFNGFGYVGPTMFALPGVKGLIPNGRNVDGTLKNTEITLSNVITYTFPNYNSYGMWLGVSNTELTSSNIFVSQEKNPQTTYTFWYKPSENINYHSSGTTTFSKSNYVVFGQIDRTAGTTMPTLSNFKPKTPFHALDWNDKSAIVGWGMPNYNTNVNITSLIPTSGSYKFLEKCFVFVRCTKEANSNATATLKINGVSYDICWTSANNQWREQNNFLLPIDANDTLEHNKVGTWTFIKFSMKGIQ